MNSNSVLELTKILEDALCGDTVRRQKAEADITQLAEANFNLFLLSLSMKISNESEPKPIRQISATIIKNMITNPSYTPKWYAILPEQKNTIKKKKYIIFQSILYKQYNTKKSEVHAPTSASDCNCSSEPWQRRRRASPRCQQ